MKRVALYLLTNFAVLIVLGTVCSLLGVNRFLTENGLNLGMLLGFAAVFGFGGSLISLLISKPAAKFSMRVQVIGQPQNETQAWLLEVVRRQAEAAGIGMPEVGIYEGEPNAFATGARRDSALVAVSTGLLQGMTREEVEAVMGHEISHVANGDMVTLALLQGVMNTFVIFASRAIGFMIDSYLRRGSDGQRSGGFGPGYFITTIVLDIVFGILASFIVAWFSRQREFRADAGSARILGSKRPMIHALARLGNMRPGQLPQTIQAFGITGAIGKLMASHPPIEERIAALEKAE